MIFGMGNTMEKELTENSFENIFKLEVHIGFHSVTHSTTQYILCDCKCNIIVVVNPIGYK